MLEVVGENYFLFITPQEAKNAFISERFWEIPHALVGVVQMITMPIYFNTELEKRMNSLFSRQDFSPKVRK